MQYRQPPNEAYGGAVSWVCPDDDLSGLAASLQSGDAMLFYGSDMSTFEKKRAVRYTPNRAYATGIQMGGSGLYFADMEVDGERSLAVAIKPTPIHNLATEIEVPNHLNQKYAAKTGAPGARIAFPPIGIIRGHDGGICILTQREAGVKSFDRVFWDTETEPTPEDVIQALASAAEALIFMHSAHYTHGDYGVQNTAADLNGPRIADLSTAINIDDLAEGRVQLLVDDVRQYIGSLNRKHNRTKSPRTWLGEYAAKYFVAPYRSAIPGILQPELAEPVQDRIDKLKVPSIVFRGLLW